MKHDQREISKPLAIRFRNVCLRILVGYGIIIIVLAFIQRKLMYVPTVETQINLPSVESGKVEAVSTTTEDGIQLHGWYWQTASAPATDRPVVLFFHGNGGNRRHRTWDCQLFAQCGCDTLLFDYRGYGENKGKPTEDGLAMDARAIWKFATEELRIDPRRIFVVGVSLGGGVAVRLTADVCAAGAPPRGLILRSTFSSMVDAASHNYPWLPVRWVLLDRYLSVERAPEITCPVLQFHGDIDRIVPFESGQALFESFTDESATGQPKRFVRLEGATHNGVLETHPGEVLSEVKDFLNRTIATK